MKIDLSKYVTNKDVSISNDDFDMDKLETDLYKGYTSNAEVDKRIKDSTKGMINKADYDKLQSDYSTLDSNYKNQTQTLADTNSKIARVTLENKLIRKGFKEEDFNDVINIRNSIYKDEKDDSKAIDEIAEKFKNTYFPETNNNSTPFTPAPNEAPLKTDTQKVDDIKITRKTSVKDLLIKK